MDVFSHSKARNPDYDPGAPRYPSFNDEEGYRISGETPYGGCDKEDGKESGKIGKSKVLGVREGLFKRSPAVTC